MSERDHPPNSATAEDIDRQFVHSEPTSPDEDYVHHFLYRAAMRHMQKGEWDAGLTEMVWLSKMFPLNQELRRLIQEMELRARIDQEEQIEKRGLKKDRSRKILSWALALFGVAAILTIGGRAYSGWINDQVALAQERMEAELRTVDLAVKFRDAQTLINSGDIDGGKSLIEEIAVTDPDYPGLADLLVDADSKSDMERLYLSGTTAFDGGNFTEAGRIFQEILHLDPNYRDTRLKLETIYDLNIQKELIREADRYAGLHNWELAIPIYEKILGMEPQLEAGRVEGQLFSGYLIAAEKVLAQQDDFQVSQETVSAYYESALALRPQDREVLTEQEKANTYLNARIHFIEGNLEESIRSLNLILEEDPDYADQTALQIVYEAHIERGRQALQDEEPINARIDFERALEIAMLMGLSDYRTVYAWLRLGDAYRADGDLDRAIEYYQEALSSMAITNDQVSSLDAIGGRLDEAEAAGQNGDRELAIAILEEVSSELGSSGWVVQHIVEEGESLLWLASRYRSSIPAIEQRNGLEPGEPASPGDVLLIPTTREGS